MKWSKVQPDRRGRRSSSHPSYEAHPLNAALNIETPIQAFQILFTKAIIDKIARLKANDNLIQSYHIRTNAVEINAYIGILVISDVIMC